jgi:radical SAM protein with 4Fe4S-binding SPASM domain
VEVRRYLATPLEVTWSVTSRCNLRCSYCLEDAPLADAPPDSTPEERARIVDELVASEVLKVYLSGGEPLLVDEVPLHVRRLRDAGASVRLTSNGTLVDDAIAGQLARAGLTVAEISLQPGADEAVRRGVEHLIAAGVRTIVRAVVTPSSVERIDGIVERYADSGVESIAFQEVMPIGRAARDVPPNADLIAFMRGVREKIDGLRAARGRDVIRLASTTLADEEVGHPIPCSLGRGNWKSCEIRPDGNVVPCTPATVFGVRNSLHEKGLKRAWQDLPDLYRRFADDDPGGVCAACASRDACHGGCRAVCRAAGSESGGVAACAFFRSCADAVD